MKYAVFVGVLMSFVLLASCKKDKVCLSPDLKLIETSVEVVPNLNTVIIDFDVVNTSDTEYSYQDEATGKVFMDVTVTMEDGSIADTKKLISVNPSLPAGDTIHVDVWAEYVEGKTYKSYKVALICED